jgi:hypothetical protein
MVANLFDNPAGRKVNSRITVAINVLACSVFANLTIVNGRVKRDLIILLHVAAAELRKEGTDPEQLITTSEGSLVMLALTSGAAHTAARAIKRAAIFMVCCSQRLIDQGKMSENERRSETLHLGGCGGCLQVAQLGFYRFEYFIMKIIHKYRYITKY